MIKAFRKFSMRGRLLLVAFLLVVSLMVLLGGYSVALIHNMTRQMLSEAQNTIEQYMADFEYQTQTAEEYLSYLVINNSHFRALSDAPDAQTMYLDAYELKGDLDTLTGISGGQAVVMLYHTRLDYALSAQHGASANNEIRLLLQREQRLALTEVLRSGSFDAEGWFCMAAGDETLFVRVVRFEEICCCFAYPLSVLVQEYAAPGGETMLLYHHSPLFDAQLPVDLPPQGTALFTGSAPHYQITQASSGGLTLVNLRQDPIAAAGTLPTLLIVLTILVFLVFGGGILYLWIGFYRPMAQLAETMHHLDNGHLAPEQLDQVYSGPEFRQMNAALKNLLSQITALRFEAYEKELARRDAQLQYLRAQIRPHFYLNCLKNLYAMAQVSTPEKMQESILYLSKHMRTLFSDRDNLTTLKEELAACQNYISLFSSMNMTYGVHCEIDVPQELMGYDIPPVTLLTLIENCVKHSFREGEPLKILLRATLLEPEEGARLLSVSVRDNGPGFTEEWLEQLNTLESNPDGSQHVGMTNVTRRFRELYQDSFHIVFYNGTAQDSYGGACIDLFYAPQGGNSE